MAEVPGNPKSSRRLAAILVADIAGCVALMGADEDGTVRDLKAHRAAILPIFDEHGGRIINVIGDRISAEFSSVLSAMECALRVQQLMADRNASIDPSKRMLFRIGINLGDVVVDDARVDGIGIIIAAHLEGMAEPGGICVSAKVHEEISGKVNSEFADLGPRSFKNVAQPVHVYQIVMKSSPTLSDKRQPPERPRRRLAAILAADIAGYSSLMCADEARTVRELKAHQAVILPMIAEHGGRIIDTAGDGILAEFASVVNAVECAVAMQTTMAERNIGIPPNRRMQFRIGINLGDVIHDDARLYGDGVNIAARLASKR